MTPIITMFDDALHQVAELAHSPFSVFSPQTYDDAENTSSHNTCDYTFQDRVRMSLLRWATPTQGRLCQQGKLGAMELRA